MQLQLREQHTLKDALISTNPALQELYARAFSSAEKLFLSEAYNPQRTLFCTLLIRTAFDWLLSHPDAPEDFETFYHSMLTKKQSFCQKHIYLQPIGNTDLIEEPAGIWLLDSLRSCLESFFLGLHVKCLPSVPISSIHCCYRQSQDSDRAQLHADGILTFLKNNKPPDALCVLGLTLLDLYPCETWSFTFGKFLPGQVGVCSFARFSGSFPQPGCTTLNPATGREELREVTCHEICHLIGLGNCRWLQCIMQGALSLDEALLRPLEPCPVCLRKLQYVAGFKLIERYRVRDGPLSPLGAKGERDEQWQNCGLHVEVPGSQSSAQTVLCVSRVSWPIKEMLIAQLAFDAGNRISLE
uniref:Archaelysin family metallopeptidase 1 n=1 Tax=Gopherus evgoodei TaxID=1825980 RepID=A0A8C4VQQ8_9SAUR